MSDSHHNLDKKLFAAYKAADYLVLDQNICINIDQANKDLNYFLIDNKAFSYAFITACNPRSEKRSNQENLKANGDLKTILKKEGFRFLLATAKDPKKQWPNEDGFIILDVRVQRIKKLAMSFKQNAVVYGNITTAPRLIAL